MKKLSILLIVLLLAASFASAQAFEPTVTVTGSATATFGVDLNDPITTGFKNEAAATIELKLVPKATATSGTEGYIALKDFEVTLKSGDDGVIVKAPTIEAKLVFDPITVKLYSAPTFSAGNAAGFVWHADEDAPNVVKAALSNKNIATAAGADDVEGEVVALTTGSTAPTGGVYLGTDGTYDFYAVAETVDGDAAVMTKYQGLTFTVALDPITLDLMIASDGTWENSDNDYAVGAKITAAIDPLTVNAGVFAGPFDSSDLGFTAGVSGTFGPATVGLGFDGFIPEGGDLTWDAKASVSADLGVAKISSLTYLYPVGADLELDEEIVVDLSGLQEALTLTNKTQLIDVLVGPLQWYNRTDIAYALDGGIKPYAMFAIDDASSMDLTLGVALSETIENTVLTVQYKAVDMENDMGLITFAAKVSF